MATSPCDAKPFAFEGAEERVHIAKIVKLLSLHGFPDVVVPLIATADR
jgi:hypothetical protein